IEEYGCLEAVGVASLSQQLFGSGGIISEILSGVSREVRILQADMNGFIAFGFAERPGDYLPLTAIQAIEYGIEIDSHCHSLAHADIAKRRLVYSHHEGGAPAMEG